MSSLVTGAVRSVGGKITRSGLDTRRSRPPASRIVSGTGAIPEVLPAAAQPSDVVDPEGSDQSGLDRVELIALRRLGKLGEQVGASLAGHALEALVEPIYERSGAVQPVPGRPPVEIALPG